MASTSNVNQPMIQNKLLKKFSEYEYSDKIKQFSRFLFDFYKYDNWDIPFDYSESKIEAMYTKLGFEKDKAELRLLLLGQLISSKDLENILINKNVNPDEHLNNEVILNKIESLKKIISSVDEISIPEYPDLCAYIKEHLKNDLYESCSTSIYITKEVPDLIDKYCLETKLETFKILSLSKEAKDKLYFNLAEKFQVAVSNNRFKYFNEIGAVRRKANEVGDTMFIESTSEDNDEEELEEEVEDEENYDYEDDDIDEFYDEIEPTVSQVDEEQNCSNNITNDIVMASSSQTNEEEDCIVDEVITKPPSPHNIKNEDVTTDEMEVDIKSNSEVVIVGYGAGAKFETQSVKDIEVIVLSDDDDDEMN
uniref:LisH domain-containing protein n=1 Tax=Parastrongyloides trichosuri TaxID=131310 RepID=A0A0N4ZYP3_PARTI